MYQCPACNSEVISRSSVEKVIWGGVELSVEEEYSKCLICKDELIFPDQIKRNEARVREAYLETKKYAKILKYKKRETNPNA